jgi:hypothetical protein
MDQRSICLFLALKELSAWAVDNKLTVVLGAEAIAYSTITEYLRQRQFTSILVDDPENDYLGYTGTKERLGIANIRGDYHSKSHIELPPTQNVKGLTLSNGTEKAVHNGF